MRTPLLFLLLPAAAVSVPGTPQDAARPTELVPIPAVEVGDMRDILGVNHINVLYTVTDKDALNEGADSILEMGSRVIKITMREAMTPHYRHNSQWPEVTSLAQLAQSPILRELFGKPFTTYAVMAFRPGKPVLYQVDGMTPDDVQAEKDAFYELTRHFLTTYRGTGKTFILQDWEGDWVLTNPPLDMDKVSDPVAVQGMIDWLNARQDGVDRARDELGMDGVRVFHASEVNLLTKAMAGKPTMTNNVLPNTHCDLYSYSAYDTMVQGREKLRASLEYLKSKAPDSRWFGDDNIYIGEFGWPETLVPEEKRLEFIRDSVEIGLECGAQYLLFWALYDDGIRDPDVASKLSLDTLDRPLTNDDMVGNWLIRPDGTKSPIWDYCVDLCDGERHGEAAR